jgi:CRISPR-associated protein Cmr5
MVQTRSQKFAQAAYACIAAQNDGIPTEDYATFAKKFPALIHTCGLAQAVAFALAKRKDDYLSDLTRVMQAAGHHEITTAQPLGHQVRTQELSGFLRLSRNAIKAASWLKRYVEAAGGD